MFLKGVTLVFFNCFLSLMIITSAVHAGAEDQAKKFAETKTIVQEETKTESKQKDAEQSKNPIVLMETSMGKIKIELFQKEAPVTVKNFLDYTKEKFFDGTIFHRVVPNFVIQAGGFTPDMAKKPTRQPVKNEATNKISNTIGTLAMARTGVIDSATSQFFINLKDNHFLDHRNETKQGYGYCVFGKVSEGMDVVSKIGQVSTAMKNQHRDVPVDPVIIKSVRLIP